MKNLAQSVLALITVAALFGGFFSAVWFLLGGPEWTSLAAVSGLPVAFLCTAAAKGFSE